MGNTFFRDFTGGLADLLAIVHDALTYEETIETLTTVRSKVKLALDSADSAKDYMAANPEAGGNLSGSISPTVMQDVTRVYDRVNSLYSALGATIKNVQDAKTAMKRGGIALNIITGGAFGMIAGAYKNVSNNGGAMIDAYNNAYDKFENGDIAGGIVDTLHFVGQTTDLLTNSDGFDTAVETGNRFFEIHDDYQQRYQDGEIGTFGRVFGQFGASGGNAVAGTTDTLMNYFSGWIPFAEEIEKYGIDFDIPDSWVENTSDFLGDVGETFGGMLDYGIGRTKLAISYWLD